MQALDDAVRILKTLSQNKGIGFMLVTTDNNPWTPFNFLSSSHFNDDQKESVARVLRTTEMPELATIRPTLEDVFQLMLRRDNINPLVAHYTDLFTSLSQAVCKDVAKIWIKVAEPKKQALFPYKNFNKSKPSWWPLHVNHIEPDHLDKSGRIDLLISLIRKSDLSLEDMKMKASVLDVKSDFVHKILDEIYYLAFYDRLFHDPNRHKSPHYALLTDEDKKILAGDFFFITVSNLRGASAKSRKCGVVMLSQLNLETVNSAVYDLSGRLRLEALFGGDISYRHAPQPEAHARALDVVPPNYSYPQALESSHYKEVENPHETLSHSTTIESIAQTSPSEFVPPCKKRKLDQYPIKIEESMESVNSDELCSSLPPSSVVSNQFDDAHYHFQRRIMSMDLQHQEYVHSLQNTKSFAPDQLMGYEEYAGEVQYNQAAGW